MFNKVYLIGNLGRDPEVRSKDGGRPVAHLSVATNHRFRNSEGEIQEETEWHDVVCFGSQAEIAGQYLARGRQIHVEGRIRTRSWTDRRSGEERQRKEIVCERFQMLGQPADASGGESPTQGE